MFLIMRKVNYLLIALAAFSTALFYAPSCKKLLSKDVEVRNELVFSTGGSELVETSEKKESVLYEGDLEINLASEIEKAGISKNIIKSMVLKQVQIKVVSPSGFDLTLLETVKLYLVDRDNVVASSSGIENGVLIFTIHEPELFEKLNGEKLHIILTGTKPVEQVKLELTTDYVAKLSLL